MKKLTLNAVNLKNQDFLSREQLRNILGGDDVPFTNGDCQNAGEDCNTGQTLNCCTSLVCADNICRTPTL